MPRIFLEINLARLEEYKLNFSRTDEVHVVLGIDCLREIVSKISLLRLAPRTAIITNTTVSEHCLEPLMEALSAKGIASEPVIIPDGEEYKTFDTAQKIISFLAEKNFTKDTFIIALGGGVICDLAGFTASIYKRGLPLVLIPTSLLAMVDGAIGGKNAVNMPEAKNMIGTFYQPKLTAINVSYLQTLPLSQISYGTAETIKHALIADPAYFKFIDNNAESIKQKDLSTLQRLVRRSINIKKSFVTKDEFDVSTRKHLNLGHTFAHAMEAAGNYLRLHHGEAVGIGMIMALKASKHLELLKEDYSLQLKSLLIRMGLPILPPDEFTSQSLLEIIKADKKNDTSSYTLILPVEIGSTIIKSLSEEELIQVLDAALDI
ncbi:MAG: 3-dehydroquinate synthase [Candidatus Riflebacteria bacterium]|nr:3-dehydroquinate synthase [Candidatus Riflebacteria bacterium]